MIRSSSASYALMRDSLLLEFVDDNRLNGGESDIATGMLAGHRKRKRTRSEIRVSRLQEEDTPGPDAAGVTCVWSGY